MKKLITILAVLICLSVSMTAYAQSSPDYDDPDWYKEYGFETDPRIDNPGWTLEEYLEAMTIQEELRQTGQSGNNGQSLTDEEFLKAQLEIDFAARNEQRIAEGKSDLADSAVGRGTVENPLIYWVETTGYPDNISFASQEATRMLDDGTFISYWEIGIVDADEAAKQEIIDLLAPNCRISFVDGKYSYNRREAIRNEILSMGDESIHNVFLMYDGTIWVVVPEDMVAHYTEILTAQFGEQFRDLILVVADDEIALEAVEDGSLSIIQANSMKANNNWFFPTILILLCGVAVVLYFNRARFIPAMQTNTGNVVTGNAPVSRKQTIAAIKNSALTPSDDTFESIMEQVDRQKPKN